MAFHELSQFFVVGLLLSTAMETLKTPSEYSVDFNRGFQGFSMANLEKGEAHINFPTSLINSIIQEHIYTKTKF